MPRSKACGVRSSRFPTTRSTTGSRGRGLGAVAGPDWRASVEMDSMLEQAWGVADAAVAAIGATSFDSIIGKFFVRAVLHKCDKTKLGPEKDAEFEDRLVESPTRK